MIRRLKKIAKWTAGVLTVLILTGVLLAYIYEDEVKQYAVERLNQYLDTPVDVEDIELTLLARFPDASLDFENVLIRDAFRDSTITDRDTLLYAQHLYLQFNISDLFSGDYTVRHLTIDQGTLNLRIAEDGSDNFHFWKTPKDSAEGNFTFALEDVQLNDTRVRYFNQATAQDYQFTSEAIDLNGDFNSNVFVLNGSANLTVEHFRVREVDYVTGKPADLDLNLSIDTKNSVYSVQNGHLGLADLEFALDGTVSQTDSGHYCDLTLAGHDMDLEKLWSMLPGDQAQKLENYDSRGILNLSSTIVGVVNATTNPILDATFSVSEGTLTQRSTNITLSGLALNGSYHSDNNPKQEKLIIEQASGRLGNGELRAAIAIQDFSNPDLSLECSGWLDLAEVKSFLDLQEIEQLSGKVRLNTAFSGKATALTSVTAEAFRNGQASGTLAFEKANVRLRQSPHTFEQLDGEFVLRNNDAAINDFSGSIAGTDFKLNGVLRNFLSWVFLPDETLTIEADLKSENVDLDRMLANQGAETSGAEPYRLAFPDDIRCNLSTSLTSVKFRQFSAKSVSGLFRLDNQVLKANNLKLTTMDGNISASGEIDGRGQEFFVATCDAKMRNINVSKAFREFEQFGQTFLQDKHLKGRADIDLDLALALSPQLDIDKDKIVSTADVTIRNGELIGLETMQAISDYMAGNKMIAAVVDVPTFDSKLQHIHFSEMTNRIEVRNQTVHIPRMDIESSVMDISIAGSHTFDNRIDYSFIFRLSDMMRKKKSDTEYGPIEDDGLGLRIYLGMRGTLDDFEFYYDRESLREVRRENREEEKQDLKRLLNEEFGLFSKDSLPDKDPEVKQPEFIIEWDEFDEGEKSDEPDTTPSTPRVRPVEDEPEDSTEKERHNKSRLKKFLQKLEQNDEDPEVVMQLDDG